ncbi:probable mitochondrial import inner membrane translocase subunit TIM21 [Papaver somniferum]|nr:probable mitochondrial import inner membrane translocase subunit TIM21 [Papaver somniferum]
MHRIKYKLAESRGLIKNGLSSLLKTQNGFHSTSSSTTIGKTLSDIPAVGLHPSSVSKTIARPKWLKREFGTVGGAHFKGPQTRESTVALLTPHQLNKYNGCHKNLPCFVRSLASSSASQSGQKKNECRKDLKTTVEDPFDELTDKIPQKPVTFTEGASYSFIIIAGLGVAIAAGYAVVKELILEPKEYKIFNKALARIQDDHQVKSKIGSPITGYGQESRNRAARQRIPHRVWTDEDGVEHVEVNFYIRGPHGAGKVYSEMFKDQADKQWKFMFLIVEIKSPHPAQLILESFIPA